MDKVTIYTGASAGNTEADGMAIETGGYTSDVWVQRIIAAHGKVVSSFIETGRLLNAAKAALPHGAFTHMIEAELPFKPRMAQMYMAVADNKVLTDPQRVAFLPPSIGTLYELSRLEPDVLEARIAAGEITPALERKDILTEIKVSRRSARESELAARITDLPQKRYGVIYADPEWRFEPYSRDSGMDRAADNHYPTSPLEAIKVRPVGDIAADDCVLFMWATVPMLPQALEVMAAWGFAYKSSQAWTKDRSGTGYWFRNAHEILLVGTRGDVPAPAMGTQWSSWQEWTPGRHSEKPEKAYDLIEAYYPNLPKIELNARRARDGWDTWGLEAPVADRGIDEHEPPDAHGSPLRSEPHAVVDGGVPNSPAGAECGADRQPLSAKVANAIIEAAYAAGDVDLAELAAKTGLTKKAIKNRALRRGWSNPENQKAGARRAITTLNRRQHEQAEG